MRSIVTFSPFQELHRFADMMDSMWDSEKFPGGGLSVPMDVWEQDGKIFIKAAVPGVDPNRIELSVEEGVLTVSGEFSDEHEVQSDNRKMYHREMRYGRFTRSIALPEDADQDGIEAEYKNGFLTIQVPRRKQPATKQAKRLQIRNTGQSQGQSTQTPQQTAPTQTPQESRTGQGSSQ
jgi:HSP20 family protein